MCLREFKYKCNKDSFTKRTEQSMVERHRISMITPNKHTCEKQICGKWVLKTI